MIWVTLLECPVSPHSTYHHEPPQTVRITECERDPYPSQKDHSGKFIDTWFWAVYESPPPGGR